MERSRKRIRICLFFVIVIAIAIGISYYLYEVHGSRQISQGILITYIGNGAGLLWR